MFVRISDENDRHRKRKYGREGEEAYETDAQSGM